MTPFDSWYSTHIAPPLPTDAPPEVLKLARESMAACWNAALDAALDRYFPLSERERAKHSRPISGDSGVEARNTESVPQFLQ